MSWRFQSRTFFCKDIYRLVVSCSPSSLFVHCFIVILYWFRDLRLLWKQLSTTIIFEEGMYLKSSKENNAWENIYIYQIIEICTIVLLAKVSETKASQIRWQNSIKIIQWLSKLPLNHIKIRDGIVLVLRKHNYDRLNKLVISDHNWLNSGSYYRGNEITWLTVLNN